MMLENKRQLDVTREKLRLLEEHYESVRQEPAEDAHLHALTLRSLKQILNQLKEEIARFECHASAHARGTTDK
jgi:hypothetical protein